MGATYHDYYTSNRFRSLRLPASAKDSTPAIHVVLGRDYWRMAIWMLASFFLATKRSWPVYLHDDGTVDEQALSAIQAVVPDARLIARKEADAAMTQHLSDFPALRQLRKVLPLSLKLIDANLIPVKGPRFIFDSDLIFFDRPRELLEWADMSINCSYFQKDITDASAVDLSRVQTEIGVSPIWSLNSGVCALQDGFIDLEFLEDVMVRFSLLTAQRRWTVEQTLYAILASRYDSRLLPSAYVLTGSGPCPSGAIMRHYVGVVRQQFFSEGLARTSSAILKTFRSRV
jgi:hypothetical protein